MIYIFIDEGVKKVAIEYVISISQKINAKIIENRNEQITILKQIYSNNKYIFIGIRYTSYLKINYDNVYYVNLEPLTCNGKYSKYNFLNEVLLFNRNYPKIKLLDYSKENIEILKNYNIKSKYLPYQVNYNEIKNYEKNDYDIVLCCSWNERIKNIFDRISTFSKSYPIGNPPLWYNERDNILFRSKILINLHHRENDYNILQELRITRCILNKIIIISEKSLNNDLYYLSKYIIFCEYVDIVNKAKDVLNNYEYYYNKIYSDLNIELIDYQLEKELPSFDI